MSAEDEFRTVSLILDSRAKTLGVDAFALSLLKAERQIRKLFTYLIYQFPNFGRNDVGDLRGVLTRNRNVYFEGFERGFDALYCASIKRLLGGEYEHLRNRLDAAIDHRNKIFHGQLTARFLTQQELVGFAYDIRGWCTRLSEEATAELGYDGFGRNSFQKSHIPDLWKRCKHQLRTVNDYDEFIKRHMTGRRRPR
jgi:hypothetical protein